MTQRLPRYAVVTPVKNEADLIENTLRSVVAQTVPPDTWIIVNDGSTDATPDIVQRYVERYPWIRMITRTDRGAYRLGGGVVEAFYEGLGQVDLSTVDFICKLDGDLRFAPDYFEQLLRAADANPLLGILSGVTYIEMNGHEVAESVPAFFAVGMAKLWRVACFEAIGGLVPSLGWDVLDVVRAQMHGWETRSFPALRLAHLRPMSSRNGWYRGRMRNGLTDYVLGYHPLFELARCLWRMLKPPYVAGGLFILVGYCTAWVQRVPRIVNRQELQYLRRQQVSRLLRLQVR